MSFWDLSPLHNKIPINFILKRYKSKYTLCPYECYGPLCDLLRDTQIPIDWFLIVIIVWYFSGQIYNIIIIYYNIIFMSILILSENITLNLKAWTILGRNLANFTTFKRNKSHKFEKRCCVLWCWRSINHFFHINHFIATCSVWKMMTARDIIRKSFPRCPNNWNPINHFNYYL